MSMLVNLPCWPINMWIWHIPSNQHVFQVSNYLDWLTCKVNMVGQFGDQLVLTCQQGFRIVLTGWLHNHLFSAYWHVFELSWWVNLAINMSRNINMAFELSYGPTCEFNMLCQLGNQPISTCPQSIQTIVMGWHVKSTDHGWLALPIDMWKHVKYIGWSFC